MAATRTLILTSGVVLTALSLGSLRPLTTSRVDPGGSRPTKTSSFEIPLREADARALASRRASSGESSFVACSGRGSSGGFRVLSVAGRAFAEPGTVTFATPPGAVATLLTLKDASGNVVDEWMVDSLNGSSVLDVDEYVAGTYTLLCRVKGSLVTKATAYLDPNGSVSLSPVYRFGDLDDDNYVSRSEVSFVRAHLGESATSVEALFGDAASPYAVSRADFDGDGVVTQADLDLATPNVGVSGDS